MNAEGNMNYVWDYIKEHTQLQYCLLESCAENQPAHSWKELPSLLSSFDFNKPVNKGVLSFGFRAVDEIFNGFLPGGLLIQVNIFYTK